MLKTERTTNPGSLSCEDQDGEEVHDHWKRENKDEESPSEADDEQEGDDVDTTMLGNHGPAIASPAPTIKEEMQAIFVKLLFSQTVTKKLMEDQGINSLRTLASLSSDDIPSICDVIIRPGDLVNRRLLGRVNQISVLATNNLKLTLMMFKMMEHCFMPYYIHCVWSRSVLA